MILATISTPGLEWSQWRSHAAYAIKHGLEHQIYSDAGDLPHPAWLKFQILRNFAQQHEHSHLLYLDADVEIFDDSALPPITDGVKMRTDPWMMQENALRDYNIWAKNIWGLGPSENYWNTGVMIWSLESARKMSGFPRWPTYNHETLHEQHQFNVALRRQGIVPEPLGNEWNYLASGIPDLNKNKQRRFVHFAHEGKGILVGRSIIPKIAVNPLPIQASHAVVMSYTRKDIPSLMETLSWTNDMAKIRPPKEKAALVLLADCKTEKTLRGNAHLLAQAGDFWNEVHSVATEWALPNEQWPIGPNWNFLHALQYTRGRPFYFMEPDCFAIRPEWLESMWKEYCTAAQPYMGVIVPSDGTFIRHVSGAAWYPADACKHLEPYCRIGWRHSGHWHCLPWDVTTTDVSNNAHNSTLMYHNWGDHQNPPVYCAKDEHGKVSVLRLIKDGFAIGHRCKDGSAIKALRQVYGL